MQTLFSSTAPLAASVSSFIDGLDSDGRTMVLIMVFGAVISIASIAGSVINKIHRRNADIAFKQDLLERGLSVDEVERVLAAKSTEAAQRRWLSTL